MAKIQSLLAVLATSLRVIHAAVEETASPSVADVAPHSALSDMTFNNIKIDWKKITSDIKTKCSDFANENGSKLTDTNLRDYYERKVNKGKTLPLFAFLVNTADSGETQSLSILTDDSRLSASQWNVISSVIEAKLIDYAMYRLTPTLIYACYKSAQGGEGGEAASKTMHSTDIDSVLEPTLKAFRKEVKSDSTKAAPGNYIVKCLGILNKHIEVITNHYNPVAEPVEVNKHSGKGEAAAEQGKAQLGKNNSKPDAAKALFYEYNSIAARAGDAHFHCLVFWQNHTSSCLEKLLLKLYGIDAMKPLFVDASKITSESKPHSMYSFEPKCNGLVVGSLAIRNIQPLNLEEIEEQFVVNDTFTAAQFDTLTDYTTQHAMLLKKFRWYTLEACFYYYMLGICTGGSVNACSSADKEKFKFFALLTDAYIKSCDYLTEISKNNAEARQYAVKHNVCPYGHAPQKLYFVGPQYLNMVTSVADFDSLVEDIGYAFFQASDVDRSSGSETEASSSDTSEDDASSDDSFFNNDSDDVDEAAKAAKLKAKEMRKAKKEKAKAKKAKAKAKKQEAKELKRAEKEQAKAARVGDIAKKCMAEADPNAGNYSETENEKDRSADMLLKKPLFENAVPLFNYSNGVINHLIKIIAAAAPSVAVSKEEPMSKSEMPSPKQIKFEPQSKYFKQKVSTSIDSSSDSGDKDKPKTERKKKLKMRRGDPKAALSSRMAGLPTKKEKKKENLSETSE